MYNNPGNTKGGSIILLLTSCLIGLNYSVLQIKAKIVSSHTADSKPVKQEVNGTGILPPVVFHEKTIKRLNKLSKNSHMLQSVVISNLIFKRTN